MPLDLCFDFDLDLYLDLDLLTLGVIATPTLFLARLEEDDGFETFANFVKSSFAS